MICPIMPKDGQQTVTGWPDEPREPPPEEEEGPPRQRPSGHGRASARDESVSCFDGFTWLPAASVPSRSATWSPLAKPQPMSRRSSAFVSGVTTSLASHALAQIDGMRPRAFLGEVTRHQPAPPPNHPILSVRSGWLGGGAGGSTCRGNAPDFTGKTRPLMLKPCH